MVTEMKTHKQRQLLINAAAQVSTSQYDKVNTKHQLLWC